MYLIDTDILSAGAPTRLVAPSELLAWMERNSDSLYLSVITVAEIEDGVAKSRRHSADMKATRLAEWLGILLHLYVKRVLDVDLDTARLAGSMSDHARSQGRQTSLADLLIAATAKRRAWTVLTRNIRPFAPLGVSAIDPFTALPPDAAG